MNIGYLNRRVKVFRLEVLPNSSGGKEGGWFLIRETWAKITPRRGQKTLESSQVSTGRPVSVEMYWRRDFEISAQVKLRYNDGFFDYDVLLSSVFNVNEARRTFEIEGMLNRADNTNHILGDYSPVDYSNEDYNAD